MRHDVPEDRPAADLHQRLGPLAACSAAACRGRRRGSATFIAPGIAAAPMRRSNAPRAAAYESPARRDRRAACPRAPGGSSTSAAPRAPWGRRSSSARAPFRWSAIETTRTTPRPPGSGSTAPVCGDLEELAGRGTIMLSSAASTARSPPTCSSTCATPGPRCVRSAALARARQDGGHLSPNVAHWTHLRRASPAGSWPRHAGGHPRRHPPALVHAARRGRAARAAPGCASEHVERRPWLLWRGTRLDRHAGPLARVLAATLVTFQHVLAARNPARP